MAALLAWQPDYPYQVTNINLDYSQSILRAGQKFIATQSDLRQEQFPVFIFRSIHE